MDARLYKGGFGVGSFTQTAGTVITAVIPPGGAGAKTRLTKLVYTSGSTAHSLNVMKSQHKALTTAAAAASQADIVLDDVSTINEADGGTTTETLAANDWVVVKHTDGTYGEYKVSSVSSLTVTLTSNLVKAVDSGAPVWKMYEPSRPASGKGFAAQVFKPPVSATTSIGSEHSFAAVAESPDDNQPLLIHSDNGTAAGTILLASGIYAKV